MIVITFIQSASSMKGRAQAYIPARVSFYTYLPYTSLVLHFVSNPNPSLSCL
jgi:hypothetical protein